jgi:serine/threonine protein kinase
MTPELWQRLKPLVHAALNHGPQDRAAFIDEACRGDDELKKNLEQLLQSEQQGTKTLDAPLANLSTFFKTSEGRFQSGELVLGRFRIIRPIGRGGMGEVYEAEDLQLGIIALKTIRQTIASSRTTFERFRQEVQLARRVSGPQVCRIHELYLLPATGNHEATAFLTMEYLEGITLSEKIRRDGPIPWKEALKITLEICEGLRLIHEKGIIHRDLKSGNIMLCEQSGITHVVLMDFGLAHDVRSGTGESGSKPHPIEKDSLSQMIVGTPQYMAPEQFEAKPVSAATDIYALGIILYELLTGLHPYEADTPVAAAIRRAKHPLPPSSLRPQVPRQCDRVIERCLEYDPERRFQSATEVAKALRAGPANFDNLKKDRPWVIWLAAAILLILTSGGAFLVWRSSQYYRPSAEAQRWYDAGVAALREGNNVKATRALQEAILQDNHFVMAHARLAEAWSNLDFDGNAQRELLVAEPGGRHLRPLDRMYLDAIHETITKDRQGEVQAYKQILSHLPPSQKSSGYVDLGWAYEQAGNPKNSLESYTKAASLDSDNPAPFMHIAVLQSRQHNVPEAEKSFQRAETLFGTEMNQEGLAELHYERGYDANQNANSAEAEKYLELALDESRKIHSVQLEIRVLAQLSSVACNSDKFDQAIDYANQTIRLARDSHLDSWAANGFVRLANAQLYQGNLEESENSVREALQIARQDQQPRVEAMANLTLASLMNQKGLPDHVIGPAQAALDYYKQNGFFELETAASLLLIRAQRDHGQYQLALKSGKDFLDRVTKSGIRELQMEAEELVGSILLAKEEYNDALDHFQMARSLADINRTRSFQELNCADVLWRLGRYGESDTILGALSANKNFMEMAATVRIVSLLSRSAYKDGLVFSEQMVRENSKMTPDRKQEFEKAKAIAEAHLGMKAKALEDLSRIRNRGIEGPEDIAREQLLAAEVYLAVKQPQQAYDNAVPAQIYFTSSGQHDSELRSALLAAVASKELRNAQEYSKYSLKIVDTLSQLQHTYDPQGFQIYLSRPDLRILRQEVQETAR